MNVAKAQQVAAGAEAGRNGLGPDVLFGCTDEMLRIRRTVERVAAIRVPVLLEGERGSGKEILANYLHQVSPWNEQPLVKVNCAAIPGSLLESELFGYEKGSFTGAYNSRAGKFEQANGGSMVLDEIADIDSGLQAKLLQVLQDGCFSRLGDLEERRCDVRIMCITNRDIQAEIQRGSFREDLYYRINVVNIQMPPLRRRLEDLPILVDYFLRNYGERFDRKVQPLSSAVMERFRQHHWPGNIRELENYLKRYVILESPDSILSELEERRSGPTSAGGFQLPPVTDFSLKKYSKMASQKAEHYLILEALKQTRWNRKRAAELLGISYRALLYKIKEAGLPQKKRA
ncbi:MAG: sigma-54-dependent Fis family transcriptional regulator [Acidobacteria bacterium]|nr:sigma-54-dependent Fis family transcriptional regulator [Acidobacteriota bacterium]